MNGRDDTTLRVIDIKSWESPVARQYQIQILPHLVLFKDGEHELSGFDDVKARLE